MRDNKLSGCVSCVAVDCDGGILKSLEFRVKTYSWLRGRGRFVSKFCKWASSASQMHARSSGRVFEDQEAGGSVGNGNMIAAVNLDHTGVQDAAHCHPEDEFRALSTGLAN
jgi:hypothetical protein